MPFFSPLRYPGGKRKLTNFIKMIFRENNLMDGDYIEPYAGGASVALSLLFDEYARYIHINDLDRSVYAFWHSVLNETDDLCRMISDTPINMDVWHYQKKVLTDSSVSLLETGFSTFFLNRTNRSGIITGGVIGGKSQSGAWKLDVRFNKADLIQRIEKIARYKNRIHLYNLDASKFLREVIPALPRSSFVYLDPPYYIKGTQLLYANFYEPDDHKAVSQLVTSLKHKWIISYDNVPEIKSLYSDFRCVEYDLSYSAQDKYRGAEVIFFCENLEIPLVSHPTRVRVH
jgi:DNA adenine methylase